MYSLDKGIKSVSDPPSGFSSKCVRNQRGKWHPTPVLLRENSHGWRSLVGCNPWGRKEQLHFHFSLSCIGEGNVNPLQCSCLENPRDSRTWWAAIYGVARVGHDWSDLAAAATAISPALLEISRTRKHTELYQKDRITKIQKFLIWETLHNKFSNFLVVRKWKGQKRYGVKLTI